MVSVINTLTLYNDRQEYFTKIPAEIQKFKFAVLRFHPHPARGGSGRITKCL